LWPPGHRRPWFFRRQARGSRARDWFTEPRSGSRRRSWFGDAAFGRSGPRDGGRSGFGFPRFNSPRSWSDGFRSRGSEARFGNSGFRFSEPRGRSFGSGLSRSWGSGFGASRSGGSGFRVSGSRGGSGHGRR